MIDIGGKDWVALKRIEFTIWNSIVEHEKAEAPAVVIAELKDAHDYIVKAMDILERDEV